MPKYAENSLLCCITSIDLSHGHIISFQKQFVKTTEKQQYYPHCIYITLICHLGLFPKSYKFPEHLCNSQTTLYSKFFVNVRKKKKEHQNKNQRINKQQQIHKHKYTHAYSLKMNVQKWPEWLVNKEVTVVCLAMRACLKFYKKQSFWQSFLWPEKSKFRLFGCNVKKNKYSEDSEYHSHNNKTLSQLPQV